MAELKLMHDGWDPVQIELSPLDLFIVTQSIARLICELKTIVHMKGALKRIANLYYKALKESGFDIPLQIEEFWADLGICPHPERDPKETLCQKTNTRENTL